MDPFDRYVLLIGSIREYIPREEGCDYIRLVIESRGVFYNVHIPTCDSVLGKLEYYVGSCDRSSRSRLSLQLVTMADGLYTRNYGLSMSNKVDYQSMGLMEGMVRKCRMDYELPTNTNVDVTLFDFFHQQHRKFSNRTKFYIYGYMDWQHNIVAVHRNPGLYDGCMMAKMGDGRWFCYFSRYIPDQKDVEQQKENCL